MFRHLGKRGKSTYELEGKKKEPVGFTEENLKGGGKFGGLVS